MIRELTEAECRSLGRRVGKHPDAEKLNAAFFAGVEQSATERCSVVSRDEIIEWSGLAEIAFRDVNNRRITDATIESLYKLVFLLRKKLNPVA